MTARLTNESAQSVLNCLKAFRRRTAVPLKLIQRLLGHMASSAAATPLGLMHMRPLHHWLQTRVLRCAWRCGTHRMTITPICRCLFSPWTDLAFLRAGVPLEQVSRHVVVTTDASKTGWGAVCNGHTAAGSWTNSPDEGPSFSGTGHHLAPTTRPLESPRLAPGQDAEDLSCLPPAVVDTITQARAPSTRRLYALKWRLFAKWCSSQREDPQRCAVGSVLSFLQERLEGRLSPSTLKVYVAAISAHHDAVDGKYLGKHDFIIRFLRGTRRLNPSRPCLVPSWDLSVVLRSLQEAPFEPLESAELKALSLKTALLTALTSIKRIGDLQAFSVSESCLEFGPGYSHVILRPQPGYVPRFP
ncbi:uncharacterized protein LOC127416468 [Myxocyprinus asiaticus]|uniref:uncharacterized protein LOC127416468 n=1 Tax=Myxocyprinus asiaticus TaxID=70543 RepID=UPI002222E2EE|nr:uncharacterized protein LOC127416468 [Myxocyprinus asiaticus]